MFKYLYRGRPSKARPDAKFDVDTSIRVDGSGINYFDQSPRNLSGVLQMQEGDVIFEVVGVVKKREATKVAKPFEVGKNYTIDGTIGPVPHRVLAITDKYIVTQHPSVENNSWALLWHLDGKRVDDANNRLIPEYEEKPGELYIEKVEE